MCAGNLFPAFFVKEQTQRMKAPHLFFIVNPSAGKDEPIVEQIGEVFRDSGTVITVHVLDKEEEPAELIRSVLNETDLVAVYGGDGSVTQAAAGLIGTGKPLLIIPGGTANVFAKELGIPQDTMEALKLFRDQKYRLQAVDTGLVNGRSFLLRVNLGIMAEMITETDPGLKDKIGQLAYGVAAVKSAVNTEPVAYHLTIDGKTAEATGVALTVTNSGSIGIGGLQMYPEISVNDGLLDIILLKDAGLLSLLKAAGSSLLNQTTDAVDHWAGKDITIRLPEKQAYLCDDCEAEAKELTLKVVPGSLTIAVPC